MIEMESSKNLGMVGVDNEETYAPGKLSVRRYEIDGDIFSEVVLTVGEYKIYLGHEDSFMDASNAAMKTFQEIMAAFKEAHKEMAGILREVGYIGDTEIELR
jgi:hypothetical protein